ncbi:2-furoate---CoA ligase [Caldalkalibacillus uzonensis]|uniref:2-furoate---CoA ligase n=1 Tax=Caldalkalibacillus uzonensis TaxID=353224 RepID=A0ABU0CXY8_9BACI|nr:AMP-binding protein [Caldalkalibacillus uzonensis]MDQ0341012.1 2-furoate---CoA ligase [Caldalkalibacillus uzonensis]
MDLASLFEFAVTRYPQHTALVDGEYRLSYEELNTHACRLAAGLQSLGITQGDRIVLIMKNRMEMVIFYWAVQKIGAVFTPINFRLSADEVRYCIQDADAKAVVYEPVSEDVVLEATKEARPLLISVLGAQGTELTYEQLLETDVRGFQQPQITDEEICLMLYTSGTTGRPKGVPRSHKNEYGAALAHIIQNQYIRHESTIGVMPLYHTMGMRSLLSTMFLNGKLVMIPDYDAALTLKILADEKISCVYLVPTIIHDLIHHPDFEQYDLSALKKVGYAGAPMTTTLIDKCFEKIKPDVFVNHYGSTEVYTFSICDYLDRKPGSAGKAGFHQQLQVVTPDPEGKSKPSDIVSPGEPGEIIVNTKSIEAFKGYWNKPDATRKAIRDGWYFTGDMGVIDEEGDLYVVGRVDDMIISGGENIHPLEVEDVIAKHPKVFEVAVVGLPHERWGQEVTAFVVAKDNTLTAEELDQFCKSSSDLANFKRPKKYVFISEIPKSPVGKILRRKLIAGEYQTVGEHSNLKV